jgi:hypothetical protein
MVKNGAAAKWCVMIVIDFIFCGVITNNLITFITSE